MQKLSIILIVLCLYACSAERKAVIRQERETAQRVQDSIAQQRVADSTANIERIRATENNSLRRPSERDLRKPGDKYIPEPRR